MENVAENRLSTTETTSSTITASEARIVGAAECKNAARALAQAFAGDEVARYFTHTPDRSHWTEEQKRDVHNSLFEYLTYAHFLNGLVVTAGPDYDCVALWLVPGANMDGFMTTIRSGLWRLRYKLSREGRTRFFQEFCPLLDDTKASVLGDREERSYYLVYIGTKPTSRGKGYARKCIEYCTKLADEQGMPCYLESDGEGNSRIYLKHGFESVRRIELQRRGEAAGIELDIMVREPSTTNGTGNEQVEKKDGKTMLGKGVPAAKLTVQVTAHTKGKGLQKAMTPGQDGLRAKANLKAEKK